MAALQAVQAEYNARQPAELYAILTNLRQWFRTTADGNSIEELMDGVLDIAPELFDDATLNDVNAFRRHALVVWGALYPAAQKFDWTCTH